MFIEAQTLFTSCSEGKQVFSAVSRGVFKPHHFPIQSFTLYRDWIYCLGGKLNNLIGWAKWRRFTYYIRKCHVRVILTVRPLFLPFEEVSRLTRNSCVSYPLASVLLLSFCVRFVYMSFFLCRFYLVIIIFFMLVLFIYYHVCVSFIYDYPLCQLYLSVIIVSVLLIHYHLLCQFYLFIFPNSAQRLDVNIQTCFLMIKKYNNRVIIITDSLIISMTFGNL